MARTAVGIAVACWGLAVGSPVDRAMALLKLGQGQIVQMAERPGTEDILAAGNLPVVMMHGMGDFAENPMGMVPLRKLIAQEANTYVHSVAICSKPDQYSDCDSEDQDNGFLMTMDDQVEQFARVVRADPKLAGGFNAIGFSQGNLLIRGYIHRFNNPPVRNFVSMHGVMMGVAGLPQCPTTVPGLGALCRTMNWLMGFGVYTGFVQSHLAQANYFRDPLALEKYREDGHFLPDINNERAEHNNTYSTNFASLDSLALVMAEDDTMVHPKESEHFGFFQDGSEQKLVSMKDAPWYNQDWFGLKALDDAHKITFYSTPGNHLRFTEQFLIQMVKKYFTSSAPVYM